LIVFNLFSECIIRAPNLVLANPNYVKKVVFPLEILPFVSLLSAVYHASVSLVIWVGAYLVLVGMPHPTILFAPIVLIPLALFIMGVSWALASLGVFLRDISQVMGFLVLALMFLSPVFYPATSIPESYQSLFYMNPLTPVIEMSRAALYDGKSPDPTVIAICFVTACFAAWIGFACFQKTRKGFADVL
jgi:lipopolysaccharide transport system permease protein